MAMIGRKIAFVFGFVIAEKSAAIMKLDVMFIELNDTRRFS